MTRYAITGAVVPALVALTGLVANATPIISTFDSGPEGWVQLETGGHAGPSPYKMLNAYSLSWSATEGNPDGHIWAEDVSDQNWNFGAPAIYLGDKSHAIGGTVSFDLSTSGAGHVEDCFLLWLRGDSMLLWYWKPTQLPTSSFTHYEVPLGPGPNWFAKQLDSDGSAVGSGFSPTSDDFLNTLSNLVSVEVCGDWIAGEELTRLDNFSFPGNSDSELTINGTIHYSGRHAGMVHVAAIDWHAVQDRSAADDLPFAAQTTIPEPGPYSLTIPETLEGHSYVVVAQMDLDASGRFSMDSFQQYEPSGNFSPCIRGYCDDPEAIWEDPDHPAAISSAHSPIADIDIYLSDIEPLCVLQDSFDPDFLSAYYGGMDYYGGCLWICQPDIGGATAVHQVDPKTGELVASHDLGDGHAMDIAWVAGDMWLCCLESASWTVRQYMYDGHTFTRGASYSLPSDTDRHVMHGVHIAWDGTVLWVQERAHCGHIYKLDLSNGSILDAVSECDFTYNKWLGLNDMADITFSDGYLWAMNDSSATLAQIAPDSDQLPAEVHYTFEFDPNSDVLDRGHGVDTASYGGMVKHGDLVYFMEGVKIRDANGDVVERKHRIHKARIEWVDRSNRDLILKLGGQYWFGSLSVNPDTNAPWAKRGSVSIAANQWDQEWEDGDGHHAFSSGFTTTKQSDGSINVYFEDLPEETYNIAWNGDVMIHAGSVLHGGGEGIDIFIRKAVDTDVNDVLGDHSLWGHFLTRHSDSCLWGNAIFDPDGTGLAAWPNNAGDIESDPVTWALDDVNAVIDIFGPTLNPDKYAEIFLGRGGVGFSCHVTFEEGRDHNDIGYNVFVKKTTQTVTMADVADTYQVRFLQTGPGLVPYPSSTP